MNGSSHCRLPLLKLRKNTRFKKNSEMKGRMSEGEGGTLGMQLVNVTDLWPEQGGMLPCMEFVS